MKTQYATLREKIAAEKVERTKRNETFAKIVEVAHQAGLAAANACQQTPMVVSQHKNPLDDSSPVEKSYFVEGGVCGFAWVTVKPATCAFARWAKKTFGEHGWRPAYGGGVQLWISAFGQSMQRKEAYAYAYAEVLVAHGIHAQAGSRMD